MITHTHTHTYTRARKSQDKSDVIHSGKFQSTAKPEISPAHSTSLGPTHSQIVVNDDQYNSDELEEGEVQDNLRNESGSLLFKKVTVQRPSKGEGGGNFNASPRKSGPPPPVPRTDSLLSTNSSFTSIAGLGEKRKVSFNDDIQEEMGGVNSEGVGPVGGAGLRRLLYRHRQTISKMLHDGENHEVWRPGMRRTRKTDSQVL